MWPGGMYNLELLLGWDSNLGVENAAFFTFGNLSKMGKIPLSSVACFLVIPFFVLGYWSPQEWLRPHFVRMHVYLKDPLLSLGLLGRRWWQLCYCNYQGPTPWGRQDLHEREYPWKIQRGTCSGRAVDKLTLIENGACSGQWAANSGYVLIHVLCYEINLIQLQLQSKIKRNIMKIC